MVQAALAGMSRSLLGFVIIAYTQLLEQLLCSVGRVIIDNNEFHWEIHFVVAKRMETTQQACLLIMCYGYHRCQRSIRLHGSNLGSYLLQHSLTHLLQRTLISLKIRSVPFHVSALNILTANATYRCGSHLFHIAHLDQVLCNLHCIERSTLAYLVATEPEGETTLV